MTIENITIIFISCIMVAIYNNRFNRNSNTNKVNNDTNNKNTFSKSKNIDNENKIIDNVPEKCLKPRNLNQKIHIRNGFLIKNDYKKIPNNIKLIFNDIVLAIFCDLRKKGLKFKLLEYDTGRVINVNNNLRFIMNVFVYNEITQTTRRVSMDIIKFKNGNIKILSIDNGKSLDSVENRPKSTQSNVDRKTQYNNIDGKMETKLEYALLNSEIKIAGNEIVCNPNKDTINKKGYSNFPCRKQLDFWDSNGVNHTEAQSENCIGINSTDTERINNTNSVVLGYKGSRYNDIFKLINGDQGFPRGGFNKI